MKGVSLMPDSIIFILLGIVTVIIALVFVASIGAVPIFDEAPCTGLSMLSQLQNRLQGVTVFQAPGSRFSRSDLCPPMEVTISARTSDEKALETIADQMAMCHRNYGEGKLLLFDHDRSSQNIYCVLCAHVTIEGEGTIDGLYEYMSFERIPGSDRTYLEYLMGSEEPIEFKTIEGETEYPLYRAGSDDHDGQYGVMFFYVQDMDFFANPVEAGVTGGVAGGVVGGVVAGYVAGKVVVAALATLPVSVPAFIVGGIALTVRVVAARWGAAAGGAAGAVGGARYLPSDTEYAGFAMLAPWDADYFGRALQCDQVIEQV